MTKDSRTKAFQRLLGPVVLLLGGLGLTIVGTTPSHADEGGISFWLPGLFGSLAAVPTTPGFSVAAIYIHPSVEAGADVAIPRGGDLDLGVQGRGNLVAFGPTYTF